MDGKRPKRRKIKDNPYRLSINDDKYFITFSDGQGVRHHFQISAELYEQFSAFELEDKSELNERERHYSLSKISEEFFIDDDVNSSVEEMVLKKIYNENLRSAIGTLTDIQKRRLYMYYFEEKTFQNIANEENCSYQVVQRSVYRALTQIRKYLEAC